MLLSKPRVLIVDDHELLRHGVRTLLESSGYEVCGEATSGREALERAEALRPNVVVLDISMPGLNGLETTRRLRALLPDAEIIILSGHHSEQMVREILNAGARGYVLKSDAARDLRAAVDTVSRHQPFFTGPISEVLLKSYLGGASLEPSQAGACLTPREREIVQLIAEGKSSKEVAVALGTSIKTAETHRANIMRKLDLHSVSDLVRYAIRNHIVEP